MHPHDEQVDQGTSKQRGASLVEYALLLALIAIVCLSALAYFGNGSGNSLKASCNKITAAGGSAAAC